MSDLIPEGWSICRIGDVSKLQGGYAFKSVDAVEIGARWLKIANVGKGKIKWNDKSYLPYHFKEKYSNFLLAEGDSVIALTRPITQGELKVAQIKKDDTPVLLNQRVARLLPKHHLVDRNSMYALFRYEAIAKDIETTIFGTDPPNVSTIQIEHIKVNLPPLPEQQKIAAILTSVDEVIEKTQAQIDKLKDLKTGMMQQLLTCGVGIDGNPHTEFKDSPVGRIPKGWEVYQLGQLALKIEGGGTPSRDKSIFWSGNIPWASVKDLKGIKLNSTKEYISQLGLENSACKLIPANTMIIASRMAVGKAVMFNKDVAINQDLKAFYPNEKLDSEFLLHWYLSKSEYIESLGTGSTVKGIRLDDLKILEIAIPPIAEQQQIAKIISSLDETINKKKHKTKVILDTKKALMQDLLTGKVRVTVPSETVGH